MDEITDNERATIECIHALCEQFETSWVKLLEDTPEKRPAEVQQSIETLAMLLGGYAGTLRWILHDPARSNAYAKDFFRSYSPASF